MRQLRELADMLTGKTEMPAENSDGTESFDPDYSETSVQQGGNSSGTGGFDLSSIMGMLGGGSGGGSGDGFDMGTAMQLVSIIKNSGEGDKNRALLLALRPLVGADKQAKIDKAVKLLRLYAVYLAVRESGLGDDLTKLL